MKRKNYSSPTLEVGKSMLRASILAGSNGTVEVPLLDGDAIGGVSGGGVTGKDFGFAARQRTTVD